MPLVSFVIGYVYMAFGSFKCFESQGFETNQSIILSGIFVIFTGTHTFFIAKSTSRQLICPKLFAFKMIFTHILMAAVAIPLLVFGSITPTFVTKTCSIFFFAIFGYLLNIGPGTFPTFSVSDPFYWNQHRMIGPLYDRSIKSAILAGLAYFSAFLTFFWHTVFTIFMILIDVIAMSQYWEIAGLEILGFGAVDEEERNRPEVIVEDVHLD